MAPHSGAQSPAGGSSDPRDFVTRYQQNPAAISAQEAVGRYQQVAPQLSPQDYHAAAHETFTRMSPQERAHFAQELQQQAQRQGYPPPFPDVNQNGVDDRLEDPRYLAQATTRMEQQ